MCLTGVANSLDLTDRILPRLQSRPKCRPELLHFAPYTRTQISTILQDRLKEVSWVTSRIIVWLMQLPVIGFYTGACSVDVSLTDSKR